jgi:hypothetical protein
MLGQPRASASVKTQLASAIVAPRDLRADETVFYFGS